MKMVTSWKIKKAKNIVVDSDDGGIWWGGPRGQRAGTTPNNMEWGRVGRLREGGNVDQQ